MAQQVRNLPAKQETHETPFNLWVRKIPWEEEMATDSGILAWKIPWTEEQAGYSPKDCKALDMTEPLSSNYMHVI